MLNKIVIQGRLTKDVELRRTQSGKAVASFTLAVNKDYKNEQGGYDADFIECVAFEQKAETISKYVHKGDRFGVIGNLTTRSYENKEGKKVKVTEVKVTEFEFLESKKQETTSSDWDQLDADDDELPFN
jgi:single-strand DNA-binding protein